MVREDEVHASAVDVKVCSEIFSSHGGALAVPTREAFTPRRGPAHDVFRLCFFPQCEIHLVFFLAHAVQFSGSIVHVLKISSGEHTIFVVFVVFHHVKIDRTVGFVGIAVLHDFLHEFFLFDDVSRGVRFDAGRKDVEFVHGTVEAVGIVLRHFHRFKLFESCFFCNLVLAFVGIVLEVSDVGDVSDVAHLVAEVFEIAEDEVKGDGGAGVSQMRVAIDGRSADIHADVSLGERLEKFFTA